MRAGVADLWVGTFAARSDAYVKASGVHVNEPISPALIERALTEPDAPSISGYMAVDGMTHVAAIDFDHCSLAQFRAVLDTLVKVGFKPLSVGSRRGMHLWLLFDRVGPAAQVRKALTHAVMLTDSTLIPTPPPDLTGDDLKVWRQENPVGAEIFPKRSTAAWGVGALRMPLMVHPKSGVRYPVVLGEDRVTYDPEEVLLNFDTTNWAVVAKFCQELPVGPVEYPRGLGTYRQRTNIEPGSVTTSLGHIGAFVTPGHSTRCPFHDDQHASLSIAADDQRVWCKAPECDAYNGGRGLGSLGVEKLIQSRRGTDK